MAVADASELRLNLETSLPASLPVGSGTAIFCAGTCFHRHRAVERLEIEVDGVRHPVAAAGMPRPDVFAGLHRDPASAADPERRSYRSGFWATVPIAPRRRPGTVELGAAVRLAGGDEIVAALGRLEVVEREPPPTFDSLPEPLAPDVIAVCMATFDPDMALFRAQIDSLRAQADERWICLVSDDCSPPDRFEQIVRVVGADRRFVVSRSPTRLGFYRNFERALRMAPASARLLALCDQDDRWHPDKLGALRQALGAAQLVYCDQRLVDAGGRVLRETMWRGRRNNHTNLASLLIANTITGAATLFRREVAELALPFPDTPGLQFHDHWLGLVALAAGDVAYVDRPLYDYVQHRGAVFGEVTGEGGPPPDGRGRPPHRRPRPRASGGWRGAYFLGYLAREVQAQTLLVRCSPRLTPAKRRALRRFVAGARSPLAFGWLATRPLRALAGRNETLGSELELVRGIVWRWLIVLCVGRSRSPGRRPCDAGIPDPLSFEQKRLRRWRAGA